MSEKKANLIVEKARELAGRVDSWIALSNALSDPQHGLIAQYFPKQHERQAFFDTPQYEAVNQILLETIKRFGVTGGTTPAKSGKFIVRVPKTLHAALEAEAEQEGVSLNQLATCKLSNRLRATTGLMEIRDAFQQVHDGYATDRVVVDPDLNARFLQRCRDLGLSESDYKLNHLLLDIRKSKKVLLPLTTKLTQFKDYDDYEFASEIAFRYLQRKFSVTLDRVICDPDLRRQFDEVALRFSPRTPVLKLRCAALNLRKSHRLRPLQGERPEYDLVSAGPVASIRLDQLPEFPGLYSFYDRNRPVFAGETAGLRRRIAFHLASSDARGLPDWLEFGPDADFSLKYFAIPSLGRQHRLDWLMRFVNQEKPLLNYQLSA